jgi:hypothetical protein
LALRMRCSLAPSLAEFLPCSSSFLGTLRCYGPSHDTSNRSRIFWVMVRESRGSSSSPPSSGIGPSPGAWPVALFRLWISDVVDISWMLGWCSPCHLSVALSCLVPLGYSLAMVIIRQNVLFQFAKKFFNRLVFLSCEMRSCWPWSEALD